MTRFSAFIICLFFSSTAYSQNFSFSIEKQGQTAYIGLDNWISCTVENVSCDSILLSTDNGNIVNRFRCKYMYHPVKVADSKIIISRKINETTVVVGEYFIMAREIPTPIASIGGLKGGSITKGFLNAQGGVGAYPPLDLGFELHYQVQSYFITAIRNRKILFSMYVEGNQFAPDVRKLFDTLQKNDIITFSLITALKADGRDARANAIEFNIE